MDDAGSIVIMGTTGAGKSTLAAQIAAHTGRHLFDLDELQWKPDWQESEPAEFYQRVEAALAALPAGALFVSAGNYSHVRDLLWARAGTVIALDYHPALIFWRLFCRTINRSWTGRPVCNGNKETFAKAFASGDSVLIWFFKSYRRRQRQIADLVQNTPPEYKHLRILRFTTPKETTAWLTTL